MPTRCFNIVRGKRLRVTRTDECGVPPDYGTPNSRVVTSGFISVALTAVVEAGDEIVQKNANGDLCINDRSRDQFKRWDVAVSFCEVNPSLAEMVSNATLEEDWDGNVVGIRVPEGAALESFALELWTGVPGADCGVDEPTTYGYMLLPLIVPGVLGNMTINNGAATFDIRGQTRSGSAWGVGPYDVVPTDALNTAGPLLVPMGPLDHHLLRTTTIAPPDAACDPAAAA